MNETLQKSTTQAEKPYEFRQLTATDIFPMLNIIGKIGLKEFKARFENTDSISALLASVQGAETEEGREKSITMAGVSIAFDIASIICANLPKCENDIFKLLASTSNLKEHEIRQMGFAQFFGMIIDFIKKEEFKDFFSDVSKLFK